MWLSEQVREALRASAERIVAEARGKLDSGPLKDSIKYSIDEQNTMEIAMMEYGKYVDQGVTGANRSDYKGRKKTVHKSIGDFSFSGSKKAIGGSLKDWIKRKGITPKVGMSMNSLEYLIKRSVHQHGIKPTLFLTKPFDKYSERLRDELKNMDPSIYSEVSAFWKGSSNN